MKVKKKMNKFLIGLLILATQANLQVNTMQPGDAEDKLESTIDETNFDLDNFPIELYHHLIEPDLEKLESSSSLSQEEEQNTINEILKLTSRMLLTNNYLHEIAETLKINCAWRIIKNRMRLDKANNIQPHEIAQHIMKIIKSICGQSNQQNIELIEKSSILIIEQMICKCLSASPKCIQKLFDVSVNKYHRQLFNKNSENLTESANTELQDLPNEALFQIFTEIIDSTINKELKTEEMYKDKALILRYYNGVIKSLILTNAVTSLCPTFYQFKPNLLAYIKKKFIQIILGSELIVAGFFSGIINGYIDLARFIIASNKANINLRLANFEQGAEVKIFNPLLISIEQGNTTLIRLLLEAGADTEVTNHDGITPLIMVAMQGFQIDILELLIKHNANVNATHQDGATASEIARDMGERSSIRQNRYLTIAKLLEDKMAELKARRNA